MTSVTSKLYILQYDFVENTVEKRKTYREAHLAHVGKQVDKGNVILGGPVGHPPTGSLGIFCNLTSDDIEEIVQQDPFVINGVVAKYTIKPYIAVAGDPLLKENVLEKRAPYREAHLAHVGKQVDKGNVILGGPVGHPPTGSLGIFCNLTSDDIEEIVQQDPFVINGIVAKYTIKPYIAVAGDPSVKDDLVKI